MRDWLDFGTCFEVDDEHIEHALAPAESIEEELPRARVFSLLDRMAEIARPRQGAPRILFVVARLASCEWLEGNLEVTLRASGEETLVDLTVDDGMLRNRLRPSLTLAVPFQEFETGVARFADAIAPLAVAEHVEGQTLALEVFYEQDASSTPENTETTRPTARPPADIGAMSEREERISKDEGGEPIDLKTTIKMKAVHIPKEAYRDPPVALPPPENLDTNDKPTVRPAAPVSQPGVDEGSPPTDEIDVDW